MFAALELDCDSTDAFQVLSEMCTFIRSSECALLCSDATKATCNPQRRARCRATKVLGIPLRQRQCAAHSGARTAEQRNSSAFGCNERNASPTPAFALQSNAVLALQCVPHSGGRTKEQRQSRTPMRPRQRAAHSGARTAPQRNSLIHGYPVMLLVKYVLSETVTVLCILYCDPNK